MSNDAKKVLAVDEVMRENERLKTEVERLRVGNEKLHHDATNAMNEADDWKARAEKSQAQAAQLREALEDATLLLLDACCADAREQVEAQAQENRAALSSDAGRGYVGGEKRENELREAWENGYNFGGTDPYRGLHTEAERRPVYEAAIAEDVERILKGGGK